MTQATVEFFELDPKITYIKAYGLQRSGTNFATHFINENFENTKVLVNLAGWKHGYYAAPWILGEEVHVLVVSKNPYAWLVSLYNYWGVNRKRNVGPDLTGVPFEEFVRNKVYFEKTQNIPFLIRASNPIQHWNNMYFHWSSIHLVGKKLHLMQYEKIITYPNESLQEISQSFDIKPKGELATICDKTLEPSGETVSISQENWSSKDYYLNQEFINFYTPELLEFVNEELDMDVMLQFGYDYIPPEMAKKD